MQEQTIIIKVKDLTKKFGDFTANNKLNFEVRKSEIFGFLGANGAGKTTAIKIFCGLLFPTSGEVNIAGYNIYKDTEKIKKNIGYMSQRFSLYNDLTVKENMQFYARIYGLSKHEIKQKIEELPKKLKFSHILNKKIKDIPLGWKQKIAFSTAIIHNPKIVFLDEPTGGVDPVTRRQFWDLIYEASENGITAFVTTHYMDEAEYCDRVSVMDKGTIEAIGKPEELKNRFNVKTMDDVFLKIARKN